MSRANAWELILLTLAHFCAGSSAHLTPISVLAWGSGQDAVLPASSPLLPLSRLQPSGTVSGFWLDSLFKAFRENERKILSPPFNTQKELGKYESKLVKNGRMEGREGGMEGGRERRRQWRVLLTGPPYLLKDPRSRDSESS